MSKVYATLRHLSIDIVIGAVVLLHFFSIHFEVLLPWEIYFLLGTAVWCIYTIDHLKDARKAKFGNRERYQYHLRNKMTLKWALVLVAFISLALVFYLPKEVLFTGLLISFFGLLYVIFQKRLAQYRLKELYVSLIYSLGILLPLFVFANTFNGYFFLLLTLIAFSNLLIFSWLEKDADQADGFVSIATMVRAPLLAKWLVLVLVVGLAIAVIGIGVYPMFSVFAAVVCIIYLVIWWKPEWFQKNERYRVVGDLIFVLPAITFAL